MKRTVENETCPGCGAEVIYARAENDQFVPVDVERREGGRIVLVSKAVGEPPWILYLDDAALETSRAQHEHRVRAKLEEPGPHRLFVFHDCRQAREPDEPYEAGTTRNIALTA